MEQDMVGDMLAKRRDRAIATILRVKENECDKFLPGDVSRRMRKVVLDEMNDFHSFVMDLCTSFEDNSIVNELWLRKIDEMHRDIRGIRQNLTDEMLPQVQDREAAL